MSVHKPDLRPLARFSLLTAFAIAPAAAQAQQLCVPGRHVLAEPGDHPATALAASTSSCRLHYEDGAYPDSWEYDFNLKAVDTDARNAAAAARGPRLGRYNISARGLFLGYLVLSSPRNYELFLPGGRSAGKGLYAFERATTRVRWLSGPMTDRGWNGTQKVEGDGAMLKIRVGSGAVATITGG